MLQRYVEACYCSRNELSNREVFYNFSLSFLPLSFTHSLSLYFPFALFPCIWRFQLVDSLDVTIFYLFRGVRTIFISVITSLVAQLRDSRDSIGVSKPENQQKRYDLITRDFNSSLSPFISLSVFFYFCLSLRVSLALCWFHLT